MHSFTTVIATVFTAIIAVEAGSQHVPMGNYARHAAVVRRAPAPVAAPIDTPQWSRSRRGLSRRCAKKPKPNPAPSTPAPSNGGNGGGSGSGGSGSGSGSGGNPGSGSGGGSGGSGGGGGGSGGMINFNWSGCNVGASPYPTNDGGPNGLQSFMCCGLDGDGWNPPHVRLSDIVYVQDLRQAVQDPASPFKACSGDLINMFQRIGEEVGVPPILLASLAMQESTCNPSVTGGAGEIGLMQLTEDKCMDIGRDACYDAETNMRRGAQYFKTVLDSHDGNVLLAAGEYNGWFRNMKPSDVIYRPCAQQQNLDYLEELFNHWLHNRDPAGAGTYRNKQQCGGW